MERAGGAAVSGHVERAAEVGRAAVDVLGDLEAAGSVDLEVVALGAAALAEIGLGAGDDLVLTAGVAGGVEREELDAELPVGVDDGAPDLHQRRAIRLLDLVVDLGPGSQAATGARRSAIEVDLGLGVVVVLVVGVARGVGREDREGVATRRPPARSWAPSPRRTASAPTGRTARPRTARSCSACATGAPRLQVRTSEPPVPVSGISGPPSPPVTREMGQPGGRLGAHWVAFPRSYEWDFRVPVYGSSADIASSCRTRARGHGTANWYAPQR